MKARALPLGGVLVLALYGAGTCRALSLRSSAAEAFLGDVAPGATAVLSRATGARLRVEDSGPERIRVEFKVVSPPPGTLKDGYEPWSHPERVRVDAPRAEIGPGEGAETEVAVTAPKDATPGQYEADVLASGVDPTGASLTLRTRVLVSVGAPLAAAGDVPAGGFAERPGFTLAPTQAGPLPAPWEKTGPDEGTTLKIVNAGEEDLNVSLSPARDWSDDARIMDGYEPAPNPRWLRLEPGTIKVRAGAIASARVKVAIPREKRYAGRRWVFAAAVDAEAGGRRTRRWFVLHVETPQWEESKQAR